MSKGRNSQVISIRVPDELANVIKKHARHEKKCVSVFLKDCLTNYLSNDYEFEQFTGEFSSSIENIVPTGINIPMSKSYQGTPRNAPCPCGSGREV